ncbi:HAD family hydrolase [Isoptericola sp. BMS4]|uniref:HAD family hydrolase n=1 Tax=Isoptericola sp. BMS4 TaxID=2527875 RepID=UPI00351A936A
MSAVPDAAATGPEPVAPAPPAARTTHLVALDIDGTLLTQDSGMSAAVRDAVAAVRDAGHHVVLASGRSLTAMTSVADMLGIGTGWMVCSNGSVTVRLDPALPAGWELDQVVTFDPEPALRLLRAELPDGRYAVEDIGVGFRMNALFPEGELDGEHRVVDFEQLWSREVTRVVVRSPEHTPDDFSAMAARIGLDDVTYAVGWTAWMDLAPRGVTKASGLERLRDRLGVAPAATVAVGDGRNDIDMLRWAGRGVAMGDADDVVRDAADEVTGTVEEDGAAAVLRSLLR